MVNEPQYRKPEDQGDSGAKTGKKMCAVMTFSIAVQLFKWQCS